MKYRIIETFDTYYKKNAYGREITNTRSYEEAKRILFHLFRHAFTQNFIVTADLGAGYYKGARPMIELFGIYNGTYFLSEPDNYYVLEIQKKGEKTKKLNNVHEFCRIWEELERSGDSATVIKIEWDEIKKRKIRKLVIKEGERGDINNNFRAAV